MKKIDWVRKLTSRKLWTAVASFVSMMILATGGTDNTATQVPIYIISIMFIVLWMSYGHISIIVLEFSKSFRKNKDIPIDMVQGCVIVRSQKSKGGMQYDLQPY